MARKSASISPPQPNLAPAPEAIPTEADADPQAPKKPLYDITDPKTVDAIAKLDEDDPVRAKIIRECAKNSGPCATSFRTAYVSWPGDQANYSAAKAYVCSTSALFDKHLLIVDRANNRAVMLPATGNAGDLRGPCGGEVNDNGQKITSDNFVQLSNQHLDCLNNGNPVILTYYPREIKQVDPDDYKEGCIEGLF